MRKLYYASLSVKGGKGVYLVKLIEAHQHTFLSLSSLCDVSVCARNNTRIYHVMGVWILGGEKVRDKREKHTHVQEIRT
jgi:hypothetical protein